MAFIHDFSDYPDALLVYAIDQMTWGAVLSYDAASRTLAEAADANERRAALLTRDKYAFWDLWMRFSSGVENLVKADFLRHEVFVLRKRDLLAKAPGAGQALQTRAASEVYRHVGARRLAASHNAWLQEQFIAAGIAHPMEIDSRTLGYYQRNLHELQARGKMTAPEAQQVGDALEVLGDIRRNVDAHVFLKSQVGGSIQGDLTNVYLPAVNILLDVFHR